MRAAVVFVVVSIAIGNARAGVVDVSIDRNDVYHQVNAAKVDHVGAFFDSRVFVQNASDFDRGTLDTPNARGLALNGPIPQGNGSALFIYQTGYYANVAQLNAAFPVDVYVNTVRNSTKGNSVSVASLYAADGYSPNAPQIANLEQLSRFDPRSFIQVQIGSGFIPAAGSTSAYTFVNLFDVTQNLSLPGASFLDPASTFVFLPPSQAKRGDKIEVTVEFTNYFQAIDPASDVPVFQTFDVRTFGDFRAGGTSPIPAPATLALLGLGFAGVALRRAR